jgi:hypothetical protein
MKMVAIYIIVELTNHGWWVPSGSSFYEHRQDCEKAITQPWHPAPDSMGRHGDQRCIAMHAKLPTGDPTRIPEWYR